MNRDEMRDNATSPGGSGAEKFKFDTAGQEIFGKVTSVRLGVKTRYEPADIIEVEDEERGVVAIFLSNYQLRKALVDGENPVGRTIAVGDTVFIAYEGKTTLDNGNTVSEFRINLADGGGQPPSKQAEAPAPADDDTPF